VEDVTVTTLVKRFAYRDFKQLDSEKKKDYILAAQAAARPIRAPDGTFLAAEMRDTDELPLIALLVAPPPESTPKKVKPQLLRKLGQALLDVMDTPKKIQPGVSRTVASVCKSAGLSRKKKSRWRLPCNCEGALPRAR
jgi:hypothetical protein